MLRFTSLVVMPAFGVARSLFGEPRHSHSRLVAMVRAARPLAVSAPHCFLGRAPFSANRGLLSVFGRAGSNACALGRQALRAKNAQQLSSVPKVRHSRFEAARLSTTVLRVANTAQPRMQMQVSKSGFPLRSPLAGLVIRVAVGRACHQPANPSIERTCPGKPGQASHLKR